MSRHEGYLVAALLALTLFLGVAQAQTTQPAGDDKEEWTDPELQRLEARSIRRDGKVETSNGEVNVQASDDWSYTRTALALAGVLALIFFLRYVSKRFLKLPGTAPSAAKVIDVLGAVPIGPRQQIQLVQVGRRLLVLSNQHPNTTCLCEIDDADEIAEIVGRLQTSKTPPESSGFSSLIGAITDRLQGHTQDESPKAGEVMDYESSEARPAKPARRDDPSDAEVVSQDLQELTQRVRAMSKQFKQT